MKQESLNYDRIGESGLDEVNNTFQINSIQRGDSGLYIYIALFSHCSLANYFSLHC